MEKFIYFSNATQIVKLVYYIFIYLFSHLADTFIQSDLQMRTL